MTMCLLAQGWGILATVHADPLPQSGLTHQKPMTLRALFLLAAANPCSTAASVAVIAPAGISGPRIAISGQVFRPEGTSPAAGAVMYVYHTRRDGRYASTPSQPPELRAWIMSDAHQRYRYETIRPGAYPDRGTPEHVHIQFWGPGTPWQYAEDLYFDDDPLVPARERERSARAARFAHVVRLQPRQGRGEAAQNFRLKVAGDRMEESIAHGHAACR
jgi:protocatechuate 3,4-dioxygenase beta subunit